MRLPIDFPKHVGNRLDPLSRQLRRWPNRILRELVEVRSRPVLGSYLSGDPKTTLRKRHDFFRAPQTGLNGADSWSRPAIASKPQRSIAGP